VHTPQGFAQGAGDLAALLPGQEAADRQGLSVRAQDERAVRALVGDRLVVEHHLQPVGLEFPGAAAPAGPYAADRQAVPGQVKPLDETAATIRRFAEGVPVIALPRIDPARPDAAPIPPIARQIGLLAGGSGPG